MDRRNDEPVRRTVETIKGDTHEALDEAEKHVKAGGDNDKPKRDVRNEAVE